MHDSRVFMEISFQLYGCDKTQVGDPGIRPGSRLGEVD